MARYQTSFTSPAPIDAAFAYLSRFSSTVEWDPGVVESRDLTPDPVGLGSAFEVVTAFLGRRVPLRYEIIEFESPNRVVVQAENSSMRSTDSIEFVDNGDGHTIVSYDATLELLGVAKLFSPVFGLVFNRIGDRAVGGLRAAVDRLANSDTTAETEQPA